MPFKTTFRILSASMLDGILIKNYSAPPVDEREILRYAGLRGEADAQTKAILDECLAECAPRLSYRVCCRELPKSHPLFQTGTGVRQRLAACDGVVVFAATVGLELDRLIAKYARISVAKALLLQAVGTERIESLCDEFCKTLAGEYPSKKFLPRFSPGYGDFPLTAQKELVALLDCPRKIGITLNDSLLMTPTKSVTAAIGFKTETEDGF